MAFEEILIIGLCITPAAFVAEYVDSTLGMGFGTTLTPILLMMGYEPIQVVPAVLFSELLTGILAGLAHHNAGNASFRLERGFWTTISQARQLGLVAAFARNVSPDLRITLVIVACSITGTIVGVAAALAVSPFILKLYIGTMIFCIGMMIVLGRKKKRTFSWKHIMGIGLIAAFNKGLSGGGYGPLVTGGQILSGVEGKKAVAITSLAEGLTCAVGFAAYLLVTEVDDLKLFPYVCVGSLLSVPLSALTVSKINTYRLEKAIGVVTIILGALTLLKLLF